MDSSKTFLHYLLAESPRGFFAGVSTTPRPKDTTAKLSNDVSAAPVYISSHKEGQGVVQCPKIRVRGINWPQIAPGHKVEVQCPNNPELLASWFCNDTSGSWPRDQKPDLSGCKSVWIVDLERSASLFDPGRVAEELDQQLLMYPVFGGDIIATIDIIRLLINRMHFWDAGSHSVSNLVVMEVVGKLVHSLSTLLDDRALPAWLDLGAGEEKLRRNYQESLIDVAEGLGQVLSNKIRLPQPPEGATITSKNICE